ncbi:MAG: transcription termination factor Rho [Clostridiales bacterium GWE2_32_10]|nr:MAG: transcription termination factor Rho [Clostridiales bacterium GWE2_32_10]HBY19475.1 transcription termination factor Rho [Clostridiales bacterium]
MNIENINNLKLDELRKVAQELKITNISKLKKQDLIDQINKASLALHVPESQVEENAGKETREGILEVLPDGFGFLRGRNFMSSQADVYVPPTQIRRFNLKTGDWVAGIVRNPKGDERFKALIYVNTVNGDGVEVSLKRRNFEDLRPIYPKEKIVLENEENIIADRAIDLFSPIGKGQRGLIVSPPKAGKTTLIKQIANAITKNYQDIYVIILLIDERPEEVSDMQDSIEGKNTEIIYSTFDDQPEQHKKVTEIVLERAKRLVEHKKDVVILLDSLTRLTRAYNLLVPQSGKILSGGLDPAALYTPKKFFGAARNIQEGGSLTILATTLVETGSKMDDVIFEEFKGTGNMELVLERKLAEKRIYPAINILKSGTRKEEQLLDERELEFVYTIRRELSNSSIESVEKIFELIKRTKSNESMINHKSKI